MASSVFIWPGLFTYNGTSIAFAAPTTIPVTGSYGFVGVSNAFKLNGTATALTSADGGAYFYVDNGSVSINSASIAFATGGTSNGSSFRIQSVQRANAQVAANASIATFTLGASDGSFEVCANVNVTTATTHTFTAECAYTDETNVARILTLPFTLIAGAAIVTSIANGNGAVPYMGMRQQIRCKASTSITIRTQAAGTYTTVVYNAEGFIAQVA